MEFVLEYEEGINVVRVYFCFDLVMGRLYGVCEGVLGVDLYRMYILYIREMRFIVFVCFLKGFIS